MDSLEQLLADRQRPYADAIGLEYDDATLLELAFNSRKVGEQQRDLLLRSPLRPAPEENDRRKLLAAKCEQRAEIGVGGNEDAILSRGAVEDLLVVRRLQSVVADVHCVMASRRQLVRHQRRQGVVDKKSQPAVRGSSRSRTASAA